MFTTQAECRIKDEESNLFHAGMGCGSEINRPKQTGAQQGATLPFAFHPSIMARDLLNGPCIL
jgi:hypothetical protein